MQNNMGITSGKKSLLACSRWSTKTLLLQDESHITPVMHEKLTKKSRWNKKSTQLGNTQAQNRNETGIFSTVPLNTENNLFGSSNMRKESKKYEKSYYRLAKFSQISTPIIFIGLKGSNAEG
jgi:hypothetical protein